ncbi:MAG: LytTR family DNA-binding domain-containing protein [Oscillospiraceae bacterium]|nr:LytTR family DNA-binding domain-containing protein [Oscillospiraceae bacterium]
MISIAICDDNVSLTGEIEQFVLNLSRSMQEKVYIHVFFSAEKFFEYLKESGDVFDIVLMDIEMGKVSGVAAGQRLRDDPAYDQTLLIYISGHSSYFAELIHLHAFTFIQKPFQATDFNIKMTKAIKHVLSRRFVTPFPDFVFENKGDKTYVPMKSIMFIESDNRKVKLHTTTQEHSYYGKLNAAEKQLPKDLFCRINRSYIVNFSHMDKMTSQNLIISGQTLNISKKYRETTKLAYFRYQGG